MTRKYFLSAITLGLLLSTIFWSVRIERTVEPSKLVSVATDKPSEATGTTATTPNTRLAVHTPAHEHASAPSVAAASDVDTQSSNMTAPPISNDEKLFVMSEQAFFDKLIDSADAEFSETFAATYNRLGEERFQRLILQRMVEIGQRAASGERGAQRLQFMAFEMCSRARADKSFPVDCPVYVHPEQVYEAAFWQALTQGVPEAYAMGDVLLEPKPNQDDYYSSAREILMRQRQIYSEQVETGSCIALDWLGNTYSYGARSDSALTNPQLAYRYRYAMTQLGVSAYEPMTNRMEATLKPENTAVDRVEALKLLDRAFHNLPEDPSCAEYRKN